MAFGKKLLNIAVSHGPEQVGLTFTYDLGSQDHLLLPLKVATALRDKLVHAVALAQERPQVPGDDVEVSESVGMAILPPRKEH